MASNSEKLDWFVPELPGEGFVCVLADWEKVFYANLCARCPHYMDYSSLDLRASSEQ